MPQSQLPARQIDIHNADHVKRLVSEIDSEQNRRRKRDAWKAFQCKNDNQLEYVEKELARLYPKTHNNFRKGNIKIAKKIVEKVAKAYQQAPVRKAESDSETKELTNLYDEFNFHRSFKEADELFTLHKYVFMWLTWQNPSEQGDNHTIPIEEGKYVLHALAPYEYDIIRDQVSGEPLIFCLSYPDSETTRLSNHADGIEQTISESQSDTSAQSMVYKFWSPDKFSEAVVKKSKGHGNDDNEKLMSVTFNKTDVNDLNRLPGGYLQADTAVDYPVKNDLAVTSINWNVEFSDLKTASSTQGHGQLVVSHPEGQKQQTLHMGMHSAISLPQSKKPDAPPTDAKYISASPDLAGQLSVLKFDLSQILDDEGIKATGTLEGATEDFASGFDRLLSEADVQDRVEDNQSMYINLEQEVFLTLKAYEEAMNQQTFSKTDKIEVHFEKPKVLISDKETLENIEKREALGTLLPHEKHMILNPNLSEEQAKEREAQIQEEKKKQAEEMQKLFAEQEGTGEEDDEEQAPPVPPEE